MNALTGSWKTSLAGILGGLLHIAQTVYQPGITPKMWLIAIAKAAAIAAVGIFASDHKSTPTP